jgi:ribonuclease HII
MLYYERKLKKRGYNLIIGVDEVGRGPLAGPVVAAAVVLKGSRFKNRIDDSKKLTPVARERAFPELVKKTFFGVGIINEKIIDAVNIEAATRLAMEAAVRQLIDKLKSARPRRMHPALSDPKRNCKLRKGRVHILIDGNIKLNAGLPCTNIIKGDSKSKSIASASIVAKVIRDRIMSLYDKVYPQYGFCEHKGYPTKKHRAALRKFGPSLIHRMSFNCV